jgi:hypothetical protein
MAGHFMAASYQAFFTKKGSLPADKGSGQGRYPSKRAFLLVRISKFIP